MRGYQEGHQTYFPSGLATKFDGAIVMRDPCRLFECAARQVELMRKCILSTNFRTHFWI